MLVSGHTCNNAHISLMLIDYIPFGVRAFAGQFAIMFFVVHYSIAYIVGAALIGIGATTTALSIFFKLRAQWENQWYKRLGCSMIMGLAVCGMSIYFLVHPCIIRFGSMSYSTNQF